MSLPTFHRKMIRKAVFPVAGLGSRFLPATKAQPKEMLTVVDKPLIQYAVEEAVEAGITEMVFVTGRNKRAIEDHFDTSYELENELEKAGKQALLDLVQNVIPKSVHCIYIRQPSALGLGHAVLCARPVVRDEPFAVILADDLMLPADGYSSCIGQMVDVYEKQLKSVIAVQVVSDRQTEQYGMVSCDRQSDLPPELQRISYIVEKPHHTEITSRLGVVGRYIFTPSIFSYLQRVGLGSGGEIQLTDGIALMLKDFPTLALQTAATRFDCGSKIGYLEASIALGLRHPQIAEELRAYVLAMADKLRAPSIAMLGNIALEKALANTTSHPSLSTAIDGVMAPIPKMASVKHLN